MESFAGIKPLNMYHSVSAYMEAVLQMHCTENLKQIFPEMKLHGLIPNFHIHVSVSPTIGSQKQYSKVGVPVTGI